MTKPVTVVMKIGPGGGRPRTWIATPPAVPEAVRLCPCTTGTEVSPEVAEALVNPPKAALLGGRVFELLGAGGSQAAGGKGAAKNEEAAGLAKSEAEKAVDSDLGEGPALPPSKGPGKAQPPGSTANSAGR
jgi:hypothetical protein